MKQLNRGNLNPELNTVFFNKSFTAEDVYYLQELSSGGGFSDLMEVESILLFNENRMLIGIQTTGKPYIQFATPGGTSSNPENKKWEAVGSTSFWPPYEELKTFILKKFR